MNLNIFILKIVCTLIVAVLFFFFWRTGHRQDLPRQSGWWFIVAGLGLILFGMLLELLTGFPAFSRFTLLGKIPAAAFLQSFLGYLLGFFFLTVGLLKWIPAIISLRDAERALLESEHRFNSIANQAPDAIILADERGKIAFWNPAASRMFAYTETEALGKDIGTIFTSLPGGHPLRSAGASAGAAETAEPEMFHDLAARRKDGSTFPVELSVSFLQFAGGKHAAGIMRDTGEKDRLQAQLVHAQKMEIVGRLAAGVAHDFNNILTAIMGFSELLGMKMDAGDPRFKFIEHILGASRRGTNLSTRLLTFSRQQAVEKQPIDVVRTVTRLENLLTRLLGEDIEVRTKLPEGSLPILADEAQIEQVLINLATNARDAMPGGGTLSIEAAPVSVAGKKSGKRGPEKSGDYVLISVSDTGSGMDEATMAHIFDPFFTTKEPGKGTGLGLAIVSSIVQQHDGCIDVESLTGRGTTFRVYLPLSVVAEAKTAEPVWEQPPGGKETILVAEDDQTVRILIQTVLSDAGYTVIEAVNGVDAVALYRTNVDKIALLFLDVMMPRKDGRQVYDEINALAPGVKVVFVSGYSGELLMRRGIPDGGFHFIPKPLSPIAILHTIREAIDG